MGITCWKDLCKQKSLFGSLHPNTILTLRYFKGMYTQTHTLILNVKYTQKKQKTKKSSSAYRLTSIKIVYSSYKHINGNVKYYKKKTCYQSNTSTYIVWINHGPYQCKECEKHWANRLSGWVSWVP